MLKKLVILVIVALPLLAQPARAAAAGTGTLFGLGRTSVLTIEPGTGASSTFVNLPTVDVFPGAAYNLLVSDAASHRLFTVRTVYSQQPEGLTATYQLVTVNTADPTAAPTVSPDMTSGITGLVYDPSSHSLFGQTNMCCPFQLVRIDPATGAQTHFADIPGLQPLFMAIAPAKRAIYMPIEDFSQFPPVNTIATFDTVTGVVSQSPPMASGIFALEYDSNSGGLFGKTFCCPGRIVRVDPTTGAQTLVTPNLGLGSGITIDASSHKIYMTDDELGAFSFDQFIQAVDLESGALTKSTGTLPANTYVASLAFEAVIVTPAQLKADVRAAIASGAISNAGVGSALLAELSAAEAARARGQCDVSANLYGAFVNDLSAQSGKQVAAATASQLTGEAHAVMTNCP